MSKSTLKFFDFGAAPQAREEGFSVFVMTVVGTPSHVATMLRNLQDADLAVVIGAHQYNGAQEVRFEYGVFKRPKQILRGLSSHDYYMGIAASERPVFDPSAGGYVIAPEPSLGTFPHSYIDALTALAKSRGIRLLSAESALDCCYAIMNRDESGQWQSYSHGKWITSGAPVLVSGPDADEEMARMASTNQTAIVIMVGERDPERAAPTVARQPVLEPAI